MRWGKKRKRTSDELKTNLETAWKCHELMREAMVRADNKAWIAITLQLATVAAVYNLRDPSEPFHRLTAVSLTLYRLSVGSTILAAAIATFVVFPQLQRRSLMKPWRRKGDRLANPLYFGSVRKYKPKDLSDRFLGMNIDAQVKMILEHAVALSQIAWSKYRLLQWSLGIWVVSAICLAAVASR